MTERKTIVYIGNFFFPNGNASGSRVYGNGCIFRDLGYNTVFIGLDNNLANIEIVGLPYRMTILGLISSNISLTSRNRLLYFNQPITPFG